MSHITRALKLVCRSRLPLLTLLPLACAAPSGSLSPAAEIKLQVRFLPKPTPGPVPTAAFAVRTLTQPILQHRPEDIRSVRIELYRCTTQAAAEAADPSAQAACSLLNTVNKNYPSGVASLDFSLTDLKPSSSYTARVRAYTGSNQTGTIMGTAWPVANAGLREHVQADAQAALSIVNDVAPLRQLDLPLQLGNTTAGGSVSGNSLSLLEGTAAISGTPSFGLPAVQFRVNTSAVGVQDLSSISMRDTGEFVIVWSGVDSDLAGSFFQRYNASGSRFNQEVRANTTTTNIQSLPSVAVCRTSGQFVVTWESLAQDSTTNYGIFAQRFSATGAAQGAEFRVNTFTGNHQRLPRVAMDNSCNFVIAWASNTQDGQNYGIYAQRYDSVGVAQGAEFHVSNQFTTANQYAPQIAMSDAGNFVISWQSQARETANGLYGQLYDAAGAQLGPEFHLNTHTSGDQEDSSGGMDDSNRFVLVWESDNQDGSGRGIYARRYDAAGVPQGNEFRVNTTTSGDQTSPTIAVRGSTGDFVVTWESPQDGSGLGIFAQRFNSAGVAQGPEFQVNVQTAGDQFDPRVAMRSNGGFTITWTSSDSDGTGVYGRSFDVLGNPL